MTKKYDDYVFKIEEALKNTVEEKTFSYLFGQRPLELAKAMNYSLLAGGKRIRPVMLVAAYNLVEENWESALPFAVALEMIHTYSLIHDDLPSMDNDDYRRGKLTNHKVFGEAMAVLAGDALLNTAYELLFNAGLKGEKKEIKSGQIIAYHAGSQGMIAGQVIDIEQENNGGNEEILTYIQRHKTAALFMAAMEAGVTLGGGSQEQCQQAKDFGYHYGMAFQMVDDLLDIKGDFSLLGKSVGKDVEQNKLTWPSLIGVEKTKELAQEHTDQGIALMKTFGERGKFFIALAQSALKRLQ